MRNFAQFLQQQQVRVIAAALSATALKFKNESEEFFQRRLKGVLVFVLVSEANSNFRLPDFCFFFSFVKKGVPLAPTCKKSVVWVALEIKDT